MYELGRGALFIKFMTSFILFPFRAYLVRLTLKKRVNTQEVHITRFN